MLIELGITFLVSFGIGVYTGISADKDAEVEQTIYEQSTPDKWPPSSQVDMIKACGIVCGKDRVDIYDSLRGECRCK